MTSADLERLTALPDLSFTIEDAERPADVHLNYPGNCRAALTVRTPLGPTQSGELLYPVTASYDASADRTRVGFSFLPPEGSCRFCGCTEDRACPGGCSWAMPGVCTACVSQAMGGAQL